VNNNRFVRGRFLRLVDPKYNYQGRRTSSRTIPLFIAAFVWLILCVWLSSQAVRFNYEINEITKTRERLKVANRTLEIKLQSMMSSEGIAKAAREKYGFKTPDEKQVLIIKKEKDMMARLGEIFKSLGRDAGRI
jgi:cell division protein FtsL